MPIASRRLPRDRPLCAKPLSPVNPGWPGPQGRPNRAFRGEIALQAQDRKVENWAEQLFLLATVQAGQT
jgi:hypothetical protein